MTGNGSGSLPFEPPEQENIRLREENARLQRLLAVHGIPIPQLAPENPPPTIRGIKALVEAKPGIPLRELLEGCGVPKPDEIYLLIATGGRAFNLAVRDVHKALGISK